jgi:HD-GYP domain-containing protein (c-di-GMP phosphodiesterase class II)
MRLGLRAQFIIMAVVLVIVTVLGSSLFFTQKGRSDLEQEMTRHGATIARNLATISVDAIINGDYLALATYVESVMKNDGVMYAMVVDDKGKILADNQIQRIGNQYLEPPGVRPISNEPVLIQPHRDESGQAVIDISVAVRLRNNVRIGAVRIGMSQKSIDDLIARAIRESLAIAFGLFLIGAVIAVFIVTWMLRPLRDLMIGVNAIGAGDLNYTIAPRGSLELKTLAQAFNDMARHVKGFYVGMLRAMAKTLESRDAFLVGHDQRVAEYAARCAQAVRLSPEEIENVRLAAQVQNLGLIAVPDSILQNTGRLSAQEYEILKMHPLKGAEILSQVQAFRGMVPLVIAHHERFDGTGYPHGIRGKDIPIGARILAVADAFDAMISQQRHRPPVSPEEAVAELKKMAGTQFDPEVVEIFIKTISKTKGQT